MEKAIALLVAGLLVGAASVDAATLIGNNPDVSQGGLIALPSAWVYSGTGSIARLQNDRNGPDGGDWAVGGSDGSGSSANQDNAYSQVFALAPGIYDVDLSGWSKAWAAWWSGEDFQWVQEAHVELLIDGAMVFDGLSSNNTNRDAWTLHTYSADGVAINSSVEVRLHTVKGKSSYGNGQYGAIWWDSRYDDIQLDVTLVPEPACLMLLLAGLPLLRRRR